MAEQILFTADQVREVVKMTLDELTQRKQYKPYNYSAVLQVMDKRLYNFFKGTEDKLLTSILRQYSDDPYIDIIYLQYRDRKTIEWIAEYMEKDTSTIKRNKKRLIMKIYDDIQEVEV